LYYYLADSLTDLNRNLLSSVFRVRQYDLTDFQTLLASMFLPFAMGTLGLLSLFAKRRGMSTSSNAASKS
jgi:hypothetical protein